MNKNITGFIDSTGVGDPIAEEITSSLFGVQGFKFSANSKQQLIEGLMSAIHQKLIKFPKGVITDELEVFEYKFTASGVKYAARDGFHDDSVIALALAWKAYKENRTLGQYKIR